VEGLRFRRQHPIGKYIVDFVCLEKQLILEIDGGQHAIEIDKDRDRDQLLLAEGYRILRFWNNVVFENLPGVLETIRLHCLNQSDSP
jgi:very-short-patch-repair endonuclease